MFLDWLRGAVFTALSATSVNIEFIAGNGFHPSMWNVYREDGSFACQVRDNAPLKDCTDSRAHPGRNLFRFSGRNVGTYWRPISFFKTTLASNRMIALHCYLLWVQLSFFKARFFPLCLASTRLTVVSRSSTRLVVRRF